MFKIQNGGRSISKKANADALVSNQAQKEVQQKNRTLKLVMVLNTIVVIVAFCFANVMAGAVMLPLIQQRGKSIDKNDFQEKLDQDKPLWRT